MPAFFLGLLLVPLLFGSRLVKTMLLGAAFVVAHTVARLVRPDAGPRLLRWYFEACGGGFVKFGQILAMRYDLLPPRYCQELARLLDGLKPERTDRIVRVIERELGGPLRSFFAEFESTALATASLAQVHRARLADGHEVVVKVLRPGMERRVRVDLRILRLLASIVDVSSLLLPLRLNALIDEYENLALEELDFRREGRNAQLLHELMEEDDVDHRAPRVYFRHSGATVLTLELFRGVWVTEMLDALAARDDERLRQWARRGITPRRTARLLFRSIMEQCYYHRVFHADPHAGNLVLLDGGTLGYIDFGMLGWLDEKQWAQQYRLFEAISQRRIDGAYQAMVSTLQAHTPYGLVRFEPRFKSILRDWMAAAEDPHATLEEKSTGRLLFRAADALRRSGLQLPPAVMRLHRTTVISDVIELKLSPDFNVMDEMADYFEEDACRTVTEMASRGSASSAALAGIQLFQSFPVAVQNLNRFLLEQLPGLARSYEDTLSRFGESANLLLRYVRGVCWLSVILFIIGQALARVGPWFAFLLPWLQQRPVWAGAVAAVVVALIVGRLIKFGEGPSV